MSKEINFNITSLIAEQPLGTYSISAAVRGAAIPSADSESVGVYSIKTAVANGSFSGPSFMTVVDGTAWIDIAANTNYLIDEESIIVTGCNYFVDRKSGTEVTIYLETPFAPVSVDVTCIPGIELPTPVLSISDDILMVDLNTTNEELLADTFEIYNNDIKIATVYADGTISM